MGRGSGGSGHTTESLFRLGMFVKMEFVCASATTPTNGGCKAVAGRGGLCASFTISKEGTNSVLDPPGVARIEAAIRCASAACADKNKGTGGEHK